MIGIWRIEQLRGWVARALELAPLDGQASGRVQDVPDVRMIRYYTTLGLIDRAAEMRGRTAFYGPKHLRQLVAIKRLQAQGLSLVQIQEVLAGASSQKLARLAALSERFVEAAVATPSPPAMENAVADDVAGNRAARSPEARRQFWADAPEVETSEPAPANLVSRTAAVIVPLDAGLSLLLEGVGPEQLSDEVMAAIGPAAEALREALQKAGLYQRNGNGSAGRLEPQTDQRGGAHGTQNQNV